MPFIMSFIGSKYLIIVGDILRNLALITLLFYVYNKTHFLFKLFLILYSMSSFMIGYYAFTHSLQSRAYSEWFGGIITLYLTIIY